MVLGNFKTFLDYFRDIYEPFLGGFRVIRESTSKKMSEKRIFVPKKPEGSQKLRQNFRIGHKKSRIDPDCAKLSVWSSIIIKRFNIYCEILKNLIFTGRHGVPRCARVSTTM